VSIEKTRKILTKTAYVRTKYKKHPKRNTNYYKEKMITFPIYPLLLAIIIKEYKYLGKKLVFIDFG